MSSSPCPAKTTIQVPTAKPRRGLKSTHYFDRQLIRKESAERLLHTIATGLSVAVSAILVVVVWLPRLARRRTPIRNGPILTCLDGGQEERSMCKNVSRNKTPAPASRLSALDGQPRVEYLLDVVPVFNCSTGCVSSSPGTQNS